MKGPANDHVAPGRSTTGEAGRCTVGLLTWNAGDAGRTCAESLLAQTERPLQIRWIDNASIDGTPEQLHAACPALPTPIRNPANVGFCAGHNQALRDCHTPYYLALNQDVILEPDYIRKLCDWLDQEPDLALISGLIMHPPAGGMEKIGFDRLDREAMVASAGLVFPRVRFPFELGMDRPLREEYSRRREVTGVTGAAILLRVAACRAASLPEGGGDEPSIFCPVFFAYHEEVDLALRLARAGYRCGVEGTARAVHLGQGSGGLQQRAIRARHFVNHWLLTLRHDPWSFVVRELPYIVRGELQFWLPRYLSHPLAFLKAVGAFVREAPAARRFYHQFEQHCGPTAKRLEIHRRRSLELLRQNRIDPVEQTRPEIEC